MSGGDTISTDDISGVKVQRVKVQYGVDGTATDVNASTPLPVTLASTGANATALKVDGSAVTQPVSGTVTTTPSGTQTVSGTVTVTQATASNLKVDPSGVTSPVSAASLPLPTGAAMSSKQPALGTAGSASTDVLSVQGIASMTALKVDGSAVTQPVSGTVTTTPPSNASTNVAQLAGTTTDTNSGAKSAGTLRVVLATDQPQLSNKLLVTPDSVALPANQSVNVAQVNGVTTQTGTGAAGTGTQRVAVASDSSITVNAGTNLNTSLLATSAKQDTTNATIATKNATSPTVALQIGMSDGTNIQAPQTAAGDAVSPWLVAEAAMGVYNGSTYDRLRGDTTNGAYVNVKSSVLPAGAALDATLTGGTQQSRVLGQYSKTPTVLTDGNYGSVQLDPYGNQKVSIQGIGKVDDQATVVGAPIATTADGTQLVSLAGSLGDPIDTVGNKLSVVMDSQAALPDGTKAQTVAPAYIQAAGSLSFTGTLFMQDVGSYDYVAINVIGTFVGTIQWEISNDASTWNAINLVQSNVTAGGQGSSTTVTGQFEGGVPFRYFRARVSAYTSGTIIAQAIFKSVAFAPRALGVAAVQSGTWTVGANSATGSTIPANAFFMGMRDSNGNLKSLESIVSAGGDGISGNALLAGSSQFFNGSTYDRQRGNIDNISLVPSAAYTTTQTSADQTNYNGRGVIVTLDMTVVGTGSVTLEIDMKDPVSGKYVALLTGAAVVTNVTNTYIVYPGAPATANVSANAPLPRTWRVKVTANNANSATYSVGASVIV